MVTVVSSDDLNVSNLQVSTMDLKSQVSLDLKQKLKEFRTSQIGMRIMSDSMGIHSKTLRRLIKGENRPGYQTLYKIYRYLFATQNDCLLIELVPPVVASELKKRDPQSYFQGHQLSGDVEAELRYDRCFAEIYFLAGTGEISKELIQFRFGQHGLETLNRMLERKVLRVNERGFLVLGENLASFGPETIKRVGLHLSEKYLSPENSDENGKNFMALYAEGLSPEAYSKWIDIDEKAFNQKVAISRGAQHKGDVRAFTFLLTDTLSEN